MVDEKLGGMGFHYGKASAIDAVVNPLEPEALLYEPQKNGRLRLVAVEFLVPYALVSRDGPAPRAFGQDFIRNDGFELWTLHAWIFKHNPAGMFASWNPKVNCDAVPARRAHGSQSLRSERSMPRFLIERDIPGIGDFSPADLRGIARKSRDVLHDMGPDIQWVQSFVSSDRIIAYIAPTEEYVREHARRGGFPADRIFRIVAIIDPTTAE